MKCPSGLMTGWILGKLFFLLATVRCKPSLKKPGDFTVPRGHGHPLVDNNIIIILEKILKRQSIERILVNLENFLFEFSFNFAIHFHVCFVLEAFWGHSHLCLKNQNFH
jgi:hypothetical protein